MLASDILASRFNEPSASRWGYDESICAAVMTDICLHFYLPFYTLQLRHLLRSTLNIEVVVASWLRVELIVAAYNRAFSLMMRLPCSS